MKLGAIILMTVVFLSGCEKQVNVLEYMDVEERHKIFSECMSLAQSHGSLNSTVVRDCESYAWNMSLALANKRMKGQQ
jgi:hypothetical protein